MSRWKLGSMVRTNGLFHLLINGVYWGYNPPILTFDPNFLGHPSGYFWTPKLKPIEMEKNPIDKRRIWIPSSWPHLSHFWGRFFCTICWGITHTIHGTGIFTYMKTRKINHPCMVNIPYMDGMGHMFHQHFQNSWWFLKAPHGAYFLFKPNRWAEQTKRIHFIKCWVVQR